MSVELHHIHVNTTAETDIIDGEGPLVKGGPALGPWQQVVLLDFDNRPRERHIMIQLVGE